MGFGPNLSEGQGRLSLKDRYLIALDQGTTSTRALAFDASLNLLGSSHIELEQYYPADGWVEHDAADIWQASLSVLADLIEEMAERDLQPEALGITNQRETTVLWDRKTGEPLHRAIVWQDRRTSGLCESLRGDEDLSDGVSARTGLLLDPYFSATKLAWLLDDPAGPRLRAKAERGDVCFGTMESYLVYRLTSGRVHISDATNASRTMLFDIHDMAPFEPLISRLNIPKSLLPRIVDNAGRFGTVADGLPGAGLPITGLAGDQQSAAVGQAAIKPGLVKSTYGTGCFVLMNTGDKIIRSGARLLSTVAYQIEGVRSYGLEGSIFNAGTVVQWLRDGLGLIDHAGETVTHANAVDDTAGVYMVPAFTGLGAPYWQPDARGTIVGLTRATRKNHLVRAGLESVAYQTADLLAAFAADGGLPVELRIDGGMAANDWFMDFLGDVCGVRVIRPKCIETTALGAAMLAGVGCGWWADLAEASSLWREQDRSDPQMEDFQRGRLLAGWQRAVRQCLSGVEPTLDKGV